MYMYIISIYICIYIDICTLYTVHTVYRVIQECCVSYGGATGAARPIPFLDAALQVREGDWPCGRL